MSSPSASLLSSLRQLPSAPGVYIFKDENQKIIYIGKAKSLKNRVTSYFRTPIKLGPKTSLLVSKITSLDYIQVFSEIEALLLESKLISKYQPFFNLISKDDKTPYYIHLTQESFPKPIINHDSSHSICGPFINRLIPTTILKSFRQISPFCLSRRPVKKPCIYSHIGLCNPCPGTIDTLLAKKKYSQNIRQLRQLLKGNFNQVKKNLNRQMLEYSSAQDYEQAGLVLHRIQSLNYILSAPIKPEEFISNPNLSQDLYFEAEQLLIKLLQPYYEGLNRLNRIEAYDISHLKGNFPTASMVVYGQGTFQNSNYRHFKINGAYTESDVDMMLEVIKRRLGNSWPKPDLILLDGGKPQLSKVLPICPHPIIALSKKTETVVIPYQGKYVQVHLPRSHAGLKLLQHLRDEAHRFSRRLHHHLNQYIIKS